MGYAFRFKSIFVYNNAANTSIALFQHPRPHHFHQHRLEAIAERFNVTVLGRHTALGDALVTAEIWLRLIPLLQEQGIHTLRQAREAAQKTYSARLKY